MPDFELVFSDCSQVALISWWLFLPGEMCQATYAQGGGKDEGGTHSTCIIPVGQGPSLS